MSYNTWLKAQGVISKSENSSTSILSDQKTAIRNTACINYHFKTEQQAETFCIRYGIKKLNKDIFFFDRYSQLFTVLITEKDNATLQQNYEKTVKAVNAAKLKQQIDAIDTITKTLAIKVGGEPLVKRLDSMQTLAKNVGELAVGYEAISAYQLSLQSYLALYNDMMSEEEISILQAGSNALMESGNVNTGLKRDANLLDFIERHTHQINVDEKLVYAEDPRVTQCKSALIIDYIDGVSESFCVDAKHFLKGNKILPFISNKKDAQTSDYFDYVSGTPSHFTITRISKMGVDSKGIPCPQNIKPDRYRYYHTKYNAGNGATFSQLPSDSSVGELWVTETREIKPCNDIHAVIKEIVENERTIITLPEDKDYAADHKRFTDEIRAKLTDIIQEKSRVGMPQLCGNCTFMSQKVYLIGDAPRGHTKELLFEDHWFFAKQYGWKEVPGLFAAKKEKLSKQLACLSDVKPSIASVSIFSVSIPAKPLSHEKPHSSALDLGLLKIAVMNAKREYEKWYDGNIGSRCISWTPSHGSAGQARALAFFEEINAYTDLNNAISRLLSYLENKSNGNLRANSFRTYLLNQIESSERLKTLIPSEKIIVIRKFC